MRSNASADNPIPVKWCPPALGIYKINAETSALKSLKSTGLGVIIRDQIGQVMMSAHKHIEYMHDPEVAEALATLYGLSIAWDCGFYDAVLECDSYMVIQSLQNANYDRSVQQLILEDIFMSDKMVIWLLIG
ncbi:conserved hypothetical protein [Ricinus communis]|uniref:RNase H type-1 domain-containing protein n=1 Tax=Ricinus communis TaxID=3988 RepID=B9SUM8_RICCO|nr:conserved hypothetical protein [Ricinus communis]